MPAIRDGKLLGFATAKVACRLFAVPELSLLPMPTEMQCSTETAQARWLRGIAECRENDASFRVTVGEARDRHRMIWKKVVSSAQIVFGLTVMCTNTTMILGEGFCGCAGSRWTELKSGIDLTSEKKAG